MSIYFAKGPFHSLATPISHVVWSFTGGVFVRAVNAGQIAFVLESAGLFKSPTSVVFLEYSLAPQVKWPIPLKQAVIALSCILQTFSPPQIVLGGESSGGNLVLAVLSHIAHPHTQLEASLINLSEPFAGLFLISPLVTLRGVAASYTHDVSKDFLSGSRMQYYKNNFLPATIPVDVLIREGYMSPLDAAPGWCTNPKSKQILLVAGTWEAFHDGIASMARRLQVEATRTYVRYLEGECEAHAGCIADIMFRVQPGQMATVVWPWLEEVIA